MSRQPSHHLHTHTHIHTRVRACTRTNTHVSVPAHAHTRARSSRNAQNHTRTGGARPQQWHAFAGLPAVRPSQPIHRAIHSAVRHFDRLYDSSLRPVRTLARSSSARTYTSGLGSRPSAAASSRRPLRGRGRNPQELSRVCMTRTCVSHARVWVRVWDVTAGGPNPPDGVSVHLSL